MLPTVRVFTALTVSTELPWRCMRLLVLLCVSSSCGRAIRAVEAMMKPFSLATLTIKTAASSLKSSAGVRRPGLQASLRRACHHVPAPAHGAGRAVSRVGAVRRRRGALPRAARCRAAIRARALQGPAPQVTDASFTHTVFYTWDVPDDPVVTRADEPIGRRQQAYTQCSVQFCSHGCTSATARPPVLCLARQLGRIPPCGAHVPGMLTVPTPCVAPSLTAPGLHAEPRSGTG